MYGPVPFEERTHGENEKARGWKGSQKQKPLAGRDAIKAGLAKPVIPGEILFATGDIEAFKDRATKDLTVTNTADRPIQVGSHCHFFEVNRGLAFDREQAYGFRLCIPAGHRGAIRAR